MDNNTSHQTTMLEAGKQTATLQANVDACIQNFEDLCLPKTLLRGIFGAGYVNPSAIQQKGILPIMEGRDVIAQAQSGSGKTATFTIGVLQKIIQTELHIQALILVPTRELAEQIREVFKMLGKFMELKIHLCTGGTSVAEDKKVLKEGVHLIVGTPGRILDLINRGFLVTSYLRTLVLDEADELLSQGFIEDINTLLMKVPSDCQICLFSATMPAEIVKLTENIMTNPASILVKNQDITLQGIKQFYIQCASDDIKFENMIEVFASMEIVQCIIYVNTREKADFLSQKMKDRGFVCSCMHSGLNSEQRSLIMKEFRTGSSRILISTSLLARGIDVQPVGMVVNFELPFKKEEYIHRVGRTGRWGRRGIAINLITKLEAKLLLEVEMFYSTEISKLPEDLASIES